MAGHSHWANIEHKKGIADKKRGKLFSKLSRYIIIAARKTAAAIRMTNLKLRYAIDKARSVSACPQGQRSNRRSNAAPANSAATMMEELTYEGFGPGGVAIFVDTATDNRNRTNGEVRKIFEKGGGNMGGARLRRLSLRPQGVIFVVAKDSQRGRRADEHRPSKPARTT